MASEAQRCANCGELRSKHLVGLYRLWCPDEKQPDMRPDGSWKLGATPLAFGFVRGTAIKEGYGI